MTKLELLITEENQLCIVLQKSTGIIKMGLKKAKTQGRNIIMCREPGCDKPAAVAKVNGTRAIIKAACFDHD